MDTWVSGCGHRRLHGHRTKSVSCWSCVKPQRGKAKEADVTVIRVASYRCPRRGHRTWLRGMDTDLVSKYASGAVGSDRRGLGILIADIWSRLDGMAPPSVGRSVGWSV